MKNKVFVEQMMLFLSQFPDDAPITFLVDSCQRVSVDELYGKATPVITLRTEVESLIAQDAALPWDDEGPGAA